MRIDGVVDEHDAAAVRRAVAVGHGGLDGEGAFGEASLDFGQVSLGDGQGCQDGVDLIDDDQGLLVIGLDQIAGLDQDAARAPAQRRADGREFQVQFGKVDRRLVGADVAQMALFLASDASSACTSQGLPLSDW